MVLRRCRTIVVLDSGCDAKFTYEDLGNAIRKVRIDLRIPIVFPEASIRALRAGERRVAVANIQYSSVDPGAPDGTLIYFKPIKLGNEPPDVATYAKANPGFPHQSTSDQWFDESQTESYRMLGYHTVHEVCQGTDACSIADLRAFVEREYLGINAPARAASAGSA